MSETDDLLPQFVLEARDLLAQAGRSLLALERESDAAEPMNSLFRAVHTLKGTSGLFAIAPLTQLTHAAEDLLCAVQAGTLAFAAHHADALLGALDQVSDWIGNLAETGELPRTAPTAAEQWAKRLRTPLVLVRDPDEPLPQGGITATAGRPSWLAGLDVPSGELAALVAIRYTPDAHCFFRGEDPLGLMRQIPGLLMLRADPVEPWRPLAEFDPFVCNLTFRAVAATNMATLEALFQYNRDQIEIFDHFRGVGEPDSVPDGLLATLLEGQRRLLTSGGQGGADSSRLAAAERALNGILVFCCRPDLAAALQEAVAASRPGEPAPLLAFIDRLGAGAPLQPAKPPTIAADRGSPAPDARPSVGTATVLRVEQSKVDLLMNLIGELVVAKNSLAYLARQAEQGALNTRDLSREIKGRHALVNRIAEEMQTAIMSVRMLPVDHVFQRFPRLVRDISRRLGKKVDLVIEGADTEIDKNIIEAIADPLIHMVRNSLDHGIELPDQRRSAGKYESGTVRLSAAQDNDTVFIRVADDGRGIDPARVRTKAVEKGLLDFERAQALSDDEAIALVFAPGFSTTAEVSDLSGRGVGMDVVRTAVEKIGGRVSITSQPLQGTTVELALPLSLAVTRIMTVLCGERLFGVPMSVVAETVRIHRSSLHRFRDRQAFVLRDSVVPVVHLAQLLDLPDAGDDQSDEHAIMVVRVGGERVGLIIGQFREYMEAIIKPLDGVLTGLRGFAGTTLLGDGRVLLILDLTELIE